MKQFTIRTCPLCSKKLKIGDEDSIHTYYCEEFFLVNGGMSSWALIPREDWVHGKLKEPHYSVDIFNGMWKQSTIIPPYWIMSSSDTDKTKIYKFDKSLSTPKETDLLMEVPIIVPSDYLPKQFAKKIKNLVIFT